MIFIVRSKELIKFSKFVSYILATLNYGNNMRGVGIIVSIASLLTGVSLLFSPESISPCCQKLSYIMPLYMWGITFLLHGFGGINYSLVMFNNNKLTFMVDAMLGCILWSSILTTMILQGISLSGIAPTLAITLGSFWVLVRYECTYTEK